MISQILVPIDGSPLSEGILVEVRRLLVREDAEVELLRIVPSLPKDADDALKERHREFLEDVRDSLTALTGPLKDEGATVRFRIRTGDPAEQILAAAEELSPSLVAMSTHGRSGVVRWLRGSVAERVLRGTTRPLLLASRAALGEKGGPREILFRRILIPLDGSEGAEGILPIAKAMARLYEAEILIVHSPPQFAGNLTYPEWQMPIPESDPDEIVRPYSETLEKEGFRVRVRIGAGQPAADILDAVDEEDADLVAMTTHGRTGFSRFVFGSVAEKVLRHCRAPLLVVRTALGEPVGS